MADLQSYAFLFVSEFAYHFALTNDILEDNDDGMVVLATVSCYVPRKLTRIPDYFEATIPRYLPEDFKNHFGMTSETCELIYQEVIQTGCIPVGNPHGRPVIVPKKQILTFWGSIANQEPALVVARVPDRNGLSNGTENFRYFQVFGKKDNLERLTGIF